MLGAILAPKALVDEVVHQDIRHQSAAVHIALGLPSRGRAQTDGLAEDVPRADVLQAEPVAEQLGLRAFPATWRTNENQAHNRPGGRRRGDDTVPAQDPPHPLFWETRAGTARSKRSESRTRTERVPAD